MQGAFRRTGRSGRSAVFTALNFKTAVARAESLQDLGAIKIYQGTAGFCWMDSRRAKVKSMLVRDLPLKRSREGGRRCGRGILQVLSRAQQEPNSPGLTSAPSLCASVAQKQMTAVRRSSLRDALAWVNLVRASIGEDYPEKQIYDPAWEIGRLEESETWLAESDGSLQAAISFLAPGPECSNPVANLGRHLNTPESYASGLAGELLQRAV